MSRPAKFLQLLFGKRWHAIDKSPAPATFLRLQPKRIETIEKQVGRIYRLRTEDIPLREGNTFCGVQFQGEHVGDTVKHQARDLVNCPDCRKKMEGSK